MTVSVTFTRESVCAGDDAFVPHDQRYRFQETDTLIHILKQASRRFLPKIAGGKASWTVWSDRKLAVMAQQWHSPRLLIPKETRLTDLLDQTHPLILNFRYHAQSAPENWLD